MFQLTSSNLTALSTRPLWQEGKVVITVEQLSASQLVLDVASVDVTTAPVPTPIPPSLLLFASGLVPFFGFARRKAR